MDATERKPEQSEQSPFDIQYYGHATTGPDGKIAYLNIFSHPRTTGMCDPDKPIVELRFCQATHEEIIEERNGNSPVRIYWAWLENGAKSFEMIFPHESLFTMCFPYGLSAEVNAGEGKVFRLVVEKETVLEPRNST
jgi:hypothetical protein